MLTNAILIAYRDRPQLLRACLRALDAQTLVNRQQVVVVELGMAEETRQIVEQCKRIPIALRQVPYPSEGLFWKTKALNLAIRETSSDLVTILDCDTVVPADLLAGVQKHFAGSKQKIGLRLHHLDPHLTGLILRDGIASPAVWQQGRMRRLAYEDLDGCCTGNSHFVCLREQVMAVGGFDERYQGYGWEDHDFNMRHFVRFGATKILTEHPCLNLFHRHEMNWQTSSSDIVTKRLFAESKASGHPSIPVASDFGVFPSIS